MIPAMRSRLRAIVLPFFMCALAIILCGAPSSAGVPTKSASPSQHAFDSALDDAGTQKTGEVSAVSSRWANALDVVLPPAPDTAKFIERGAEDYARSIHLYYAYYGTALAHRRDLFGWQLWSSRVIFWLVVLLVLSGVVLAIIQFFRDRTQTISTVAASPKGIQVSSPVLGVILLTLSLAFFYLYLVYVYPIHEAISVAGR